MTKLLFFFRNDIHKSSYTFCQIKIFHSKSYEIQGRVSKLKALNFCNFIFYNLKDTFSYAQLCIILVGHCCCCRFWGLVMAYKHWDFINALIELSLRNLIHMLSCYIHILNLLYSNFHICTNQDISLLYFKPWIRVKNLELF